MELCHPTQPINKDKLSGSSLSCFYTEKASISKFSFNFDLFLYIILCAGLIESNCNIEMRGNKAGVFYI